VAAAWFWLVEMLQRVREHKPAVTEAEFRELADWFGAHAARLFVPDEVFEMEDGRRTSLLCLRAGLARGLRAMGVTELVEDLRLIRVRYVPQP
jgi:hypothetical protein